MGHSFADEPQELGGAARPAGERSLGPMDRLLRETAELRSNVVNHPVFESAGTSLAATRVFMEHHVFAVWDFMSLLKALQGAVGGAGIPWVPRGTATARRLLNEIVLSEESDRVGDRVLSHFEMYLEAMQEAGADTNGILSLLQGLEQGASIGCALEHPSVPAAARRFVLHTLDAIHSGRRHILAAAFTIGRENLIPEMFRRLVGSPSLPTTRLFRLYLERHIEVDEGRHGPLARRLLDDLCGDDLRLWDEATLAASTALAARRALWDAILEGQPSSAP